MIYSSLLVLAGAAGAFGTPAVANYKRQDQPRGTNPVGTNPIVNFQTEFLGNQVASNSCSHRDLGFTGQLGGQWYSVFGDTLWCATGVTDPASDPSGFHGMVRNSISRLGTDPLSVEDLYLNMDAPVAHQNEFLTPDAAFGETDLYPFGVSSICETDSTTQTGAMYILVVRIHDLQRNRIEMSVILTISSSHQTLRPLVLALLRSRSRMAFQL